MSCAALAATGGTVALQLLGALALVLVGLGVVLVLRRRRRRGGRHVGISIAVTLLLVAGVTAIGVPGSLEPAQAAGTCSLTITQTSTMIGLAPGRAPEAITGLVTNNGSDDTDIVAIVVSIASVTKAPGPGAPAGICSASDFILVTPRMAVGVTLAAGGSTTFSGASIGFQNGPTNQNACKGSTVHLAYTTVP